MYLFFIDLGSIGIVTVSFSLILEISGEKYKTMMGQLMMLGFVAGEVILGIVAIFVRDYKQFQITLSVPCFILLVAHFAIPESPRWLIAKRKYLEAHKIVTEASRFNKVKCQLINL